MFSIIVAIALNNAIGRNNDLIWHISDDLKRFKKLTTGRTIIMGRKTYQSLPKGALPNRTNVVVTKNPSFKPQNCLVLHSLDEVLLKYKDVEEEVFIIGGGSVYEELMPHTHKIYLTKVHESFIADVYFPKIDMNEWEIISVEHHRKGSKNEFDYSFIDLIRKV